MTTQTTPRVARCRLPSVARGIIRLDVPGIVVVAVPAVDGVPGLLLIHDEAELNDGASATNSCDRILSMVDKSWGPDFKAREANVIECDSEGMYDHLHVHWGKDFLPHVGWTPVRWAGAVPRTRDAFTGLFGEQAQRALAAKDEFLAQWS